MSWCITVGVIKQMIKPHIKRLNACLHLPLHHKTNQQ